MITKNIKETNLPNMFNLFNDYIDIGIPNDSLTLVFLNWVVLIHLVLFGILFSYVGYQLLRDEESLKADAIRDLKQQKDTKKSQ